MNTSQGRLSRRQRIESDLRMMKAMAKITPAAAKSRGSSTSTVADRWEAIVDRQPDKVAMIDASDKVVLLMDSSKMQSRRGIQTCPLEKIVTILTDEDFSYPLPPEVQERVQVIKRS